MSTYDWPSVSFIRSAGFNLRGMVVSGPPTLTGRIQVGSIDAGYWTANLVGSVRTKTTVKLYRAFKALLEGGAHQVRVPVIDCRQAPWPDDSTSAPLTSFSDDATFSDGTQFSQWRIAAVMAAAASLRATQITVDFLDAGELLGGEYFSIGGDRLYQIKQILSTVGTESVITISPSLREAVDVGVSLNFDKPVCKMQLIDESSGDLFLDLGKRGPVEMSFVESF